MPANASRKSLKKESSVLSLQYFLIMAIIPDAASTIIAPLDCETKISSKIITSN